MLFVQNPNNYAAGAANGWLNFGFQKGLKTHLEPLFHEAKPDLGMVVEHIPNGFNAEIGIASMEVKSEMVAMLYGLNPSSDIITLASGKKILMKPFHTSNITRAALVVPAKSWTGAFSASEPVYMVVALEAAQILGAIDYGNDNENTVLWGGTIKGIAPLSTTFGIIPGLTWVDDGGTGLNFDSTSAGPGATITGLFTTT